MVGKHDKVEAVKFSWQPMPDEFYKARVNALERENERLRIKINELEKNVGVYELTVDHIDVVHDGIVGELKDEIDELKQVNNDLKEALVRAALREV